MPAYSPRFEKLGLAALALSGYLLWGVCPSYGVSIGMPEITVRATDGIETDTHYTAPGATIMMDASIVLPVTDADTPRPPHVDVYIGIIGPDGGTAFWTGSPQAPTLVRGPATPFLANIAPTKSVSYHFVAQDFASRQDHGWYKLYGVVVPAGSDPADPRYWLSSSFFPFLVDQSALRLDLYTIGATVVNDSPNCAWVTPYWSNALAPWHIFDGDDTRPRFVEAGKSYKFQYLIIPKNPAAPAVQIRIRAEVQRGPGCSGGNIADVEGVYKDFHPREGILDSCAHVQHAAGGIFSVSQPTQTSTCN